MRVLFTGGSSFTGFWFVKELLAGGHNVLVTLQDAMGFYAEGRRSRIELLRDAGAILIEGCSFGSTKFLSIIDGGIDLICHHGAQVTNYKSLDFNVIDAVRENTLNLRQVIEKSKKSELKGIVITGSVFEQDEGIGSQPLRAFSPYGLSKGLSWQVFRYWGEQLGFPVHKFVIPNPFGPYEEPRFCAYLMSKWSKGEVAHINTPNYIRDNIHVSLLGVCYKNFLERIIACDGHLHFAPSGYVESQKAFATRFKQEIGGRLNLNAELAFAIQSEFNEPDVRFNADPLSDCDNGWSEIIAWDELASYYEKIYF